MRAFPRGFLDILNRPSTYFDLPGPNSGSRGCELENGVYVL